VNLLIVSASMPYFQLLPGFAEDVLGAGKSELSVLISIQGIGSLGGSLFIASLPSRGRGKLMLMSSLLLGGSLILFSASSSYWLTAAILIIVGVGQSGRMSLSNVLVQSYSADEYRGRVMSIYMMEFGLTMIGTFFVGVLAATIGPQWAIGITAAWLCVLVTYLLLRSQLARLD
jgi:MFS family permease